VGKHVNETLQLTGDELSELWKKLDAATAKTKYIALDTDIFRKLLLDHGKLLRAP